MCSASRHSLTQSACNDNSALKSLGNCPVRVLSHTILKQLVNYNNYPLGGNSSCFPDEATRWNSQKSCSEWCIAVFFPSSPRLVIYVEKGKLDIAGRTARIPCTGRFRKNEKGGSTLASPPSSYFFTLRILQCYFI